MSLRKKIKRGYATKENCDEFIPTIQLPLSCRLSLLPSLSEEQMLFSDKADLAVSYCCLSCLTQMLIQRQSSSALVLAGELRMNMDEQTSKVVQFRKYGSLGILRNTFLCI